MKFPSRPPAGPSGTAVIVRKQQHHEILPSWREHPRGIPQTTPLSKRFLSSVVLPPLSFLPTQLFVPLPSRESESRTLHKTYPISLLLSLFLCLCGRSVLLLAYLALFGFRERKINETKKKFLISVFLDSPPENGFLFSPSPVPSIWNPIIQIPHFLYFLFIFLLFSPRHPSRALLLVGLSVLDNLEEFYSFFILVVFVKNVIFPPKLVQKNLKLRLVFLFPIFFFETKQRKRVLLFLGVGLK